MLQFSPSQHEEATMVDIQIKTSSGSFSAYLAVPAQTPAPAIVVIQEIFGVNADMRQKCDELAAQGYLAICPDLFWRMEPGVQLTDKSEAEWAKAFDFFNRFDVDKGVEDLALTLKFIRDHEKSNGVAGAIGYCLGGKLAYLMSARTDVDASVSYYGVGLDALLGEAASIKKPLMLHIAEEDKFVNKDAQAKIKEDLASHPNVTIHSYAGVNHAFARINGEHYNKGAAVFANKRTTAFFRDTLKNAVANKGAA